MAEHTEATAGHQIDRIGGFALAEQRRAPRQDEAREFALDRRYVPGIELGEQRCALQRPAEPQQRCVLVRGGDGGHRRDLIFP